MTKEEVYLSLINSEFFTDLKHLDNFFLEEYEIAKIFLKKFGVQNISYPIQESINKDAYSEWLSVSMEVKIFYEVSWLSGYMPSLMRGSLEVDGFISDLHNLKEIQGNLYLAKAYIQKASKLEAVGGNLIATNNSLSELPNLRFVGNFLKINSKIKEFPKLESVGEIFVNFDEKEYWKDYFIKTGRAELSKLVR